MSDLVIQERRDHILVALVSNPPVNALNPGVAAGLMAAVDQANRDEQVHAVVIGGAGRTFVAGADISALDRAAWGDLDAAPDLHGLLDRIETCRVPVVMALHGTVLGGGNELAMAGHYRVAAAGTQIGQPEVNLGVIPGAGGTQRLPRLVGVEKALDLCVTGRAIRADEALASGLVDAIVDGDLLAQAVACAATVAARSGRHRRTSQRDERLGDEASNAPLFASARTLAATIRPRQTAPLRAVDAVAAATTIPFAAGCRREREIFIDCIQGEQAKALIHLFFAERAAGKIRGVGKNVAPLLVANVGVIGAGIMGGGIAMACANAGINVRLMDTTADALERGLTTVRQNYARSVSRGCLKQEEADARLSRLGAQIDYAGFDQVDLVVEAAVEHLDVKRQIFQQLSTLTRPDCILGTNTSTLDVDAVADASGRPAMVVGLHFSSPADVMRLLEIVRGRATSATVLATAQAFGKRLGKVGVTVGNGPGFVGNRMLATYRHEAQCMVEEGATTEQVDRALTGFGMAMGTFAVDDRAGLDVRKAGIPQRMLTDGDIVKRAIYALVNEGARVLGEGLAERASDIDVIFAAGYGFPGWRGGPLFYADRVGLARVLARVRAFQAELGDRWQPAPLLEQLVADGRTFRDRDRAAAGG